MNYTDRETAWTIIIELKWFDFDKDENGRGLPKTVISRKFSSERKQGDEPCYPVNDEVNGLSYKKYKGLAAKEKHAIFAGRLREYKYYHMNEVIELLLGL